MASVPENATSHVGHDVKVLSMNFDGTYVITPVKELREADQLALRNVNQLHFIKHRSGRVMQWVGEHLSILCWNFPLNPEQAQTASLLLTLEDR